MEQWSMGVMLEEWHYKKANDQLSKKVNGQSLKLIFNDGQSEVLQSAQLGVSYNKDNSLNQLMKNQNKWACL